MTHTVRLLLTNLGLPNDPSTQDEKLYSDIAPLYSAIKLLAASLDLYSGGKLLTFTEAITYGQMVSIYNVPPEAGRLANATGNTKVAHGFCLAAGLIACSGIIEALTGLVPGAIYYLSTVGGGITVTKPAAVGNIVQPVGFALSPTELYFNPTLLYTQL